MATGDGVVTKLTNIESIEGADRIVRAQLLGETVIVGTDQEEGSLGILFDMETKLAPEFLKHNNLYSHSDMNRNPEVKGYFSDNGRVRPIRLRGVKVSAFWIPMNALAYSKIDWGLLKEGDVISDPTVSSKYMPPVKGNPTGKKGERRALLSNMFKEHFDTDHLLKSLRDVPLGSEFVITKKLHGTSARYGKVLVQVPQGRVEKFIAKLLSPFLDYKNEVWANVVGSRTVVKSAEGVWENPDKGYYSTDLWTRISQMVFGDRLLKGETVFFEIVGYDGEGTLMPSSSPEELKKILSKEEYKTFVETFGECITYNYGCNIGEWDVYVYRITHTTMDGDSIDLGWEQVKARCEQLGVKHVPQIIKGERLENKEWYLYGERFTDDRDFSDAMERLAGEAHHNGTHAEGICLRVDTYPTCKIWKHKAQNFKIMEFGLKEKGVVTMEESEATTDEQV